MGCRFVDLGVIFGDSEFRVGSLGLIHSAMWVFGSGFEVYSWRFGVEGSKVQESGFRGWCFEFWV